MQVIANLVCPNTDSLRSSGPTLYMNETLVRLLIATSHVTCRPSGNTVSNRHARYVVTQIVMFECTVLRFISCLFFMLIQVADYHGTRGVPTIRQYRAKPTDSVYRHSDSCTRSTMYRPALILKLAWSHPPAGIGSPGSNVPDNGCETGCWCAHFFFILIVTTASSSPSSRSLSMSIPAWRTMSTARSIEL